MVFACLFSGSIHAQIQWVAGPDMSDPRQAILAYPAHKVVSMIKAGEISCVELMELVLERIEDVKTRGLMLWLNSAPRQWMKQRLPMPKLS
jgi:hypothetical protein